jgi:hypothetical protein
MSRMFKDAFEFNQDLSCWCVDEFEEEPFAFSEFSALDVQHHPLWGTCPQENNCGEVAVSESLKNRVWIYPNPSSRSIFIGGDAPVEAFSIFTMEGKVLLQGKFQENGKGIDISSLPQGSYVLQLKEIPERFRLIKN